MKIYSLLLSCDASETLPNGETSVTDWSRASSLSQSRCLGIFPFTTGNLSLYAEKSKGRITKDTCTKRDAIQEVLRECRHHAFSFCRSKRRLSPALKARVSLVRIGGDPWLRVTCKYGPDQCGSVATHHGTGCFVIGCGTKDKGRGLRIFWNFTVVEIPLYQHSRILGRRLQGTKLLTSENVAFY